MTTDIDYTSRDFDGFRASLLAYARQNFPEWDPGSPGDFGVLMIELLSYLGDINSYYIDRAQNESYLTSATQASSILNIARLLGYVPGTGTPAHGEVTFKTPTSATEVSMPSAVVPAGTRVATEYLESLDAPLIFETDYEVTVPGNGECVIVSVTEGETQVDPVTKGPVIVGQSTGEAEQSFRIPTPRVYTDTVRVYVANAEWRKVNHLLDADADDHVFQVWNDDSGYTWVIFGDNLNGAIPSNGLDVSVICRTGYGSAGNIPAGTITYLFDDVAGGVFIEQDPLTSGLSTSTATLGGSDPETIEETRKNAPKVIRSQDRAVTLEDFKNLALGINGVTKANAVSNTFTSVMVYILGPDGGMPGQVLKDTVARELQRRALAGVTVIVGDPVFQEIGFGGTVQVYPNYDVNRVLDDLTIAVSSMFNLKNAEFGMRITQSDVYKKAMSVPGVAKLDLGYWNWGNSLYTSYFNEIRFLPWEFPIPYVGDNYFWFDAYEGVPD